MRALSAARDPIALLLALASAVTLLAAQEGPVVSAVSAVSVLLFRVGAQFVADRRAPPKTPPATRFPPSPPGEPWHHPLTRRESEVAVLVAEGLTNKQIAQVLPSERTVDGHLTDRGVDSHVQHIMDKLSKELGTEVNRRAQISAWVTERRPRGSSPTPPAR